jgi:hypothetical protein
MILHICELVSGWEVVFSIHMGEENKWYCTFMGSQMIF